MKLRRVRIGTEIAVQVRSEHGWISLADILAALPPRLCGAQGPRWSQDIVAFLGAPDDVRAAVHDTLAQHDGERDVDASVLIPFEPRSYRDFALFEGHMVGAARGFVRKFWPHLLPVIGAYEGEALAYLSRSQRLHPGEFFGSGTLPGGSGIEAGRLLAVGDLIEIGIERIGTLSNRIVEGAHATRGGK
jgi:hypothetical protein